LVENAAPVDSNAVARLMAAFRQNAGKGRALICIGTLPPGAPPTLYRDIAALCERGTPVIVDAQGEALLCAIETQPLIVKPNRTELAAATRIDCATESGLSAAIRRLHRGGARWVLVTNGAAAVELSDGRVRTRFTPPPVHVQNPVGSGDTLTAGLAVALMDGKSVPDAVRFGIACGAANAAGPGYGRLDAALVLRLLKRVREITA
jgi:fructose-1-phosphate kinase PfkB-like protein